MAPPDKRRRNAAILFDLENFKIAWQSHYRTLLSYNDICALINKMEEIHNLNVISIKIYGTATISTTERIKRQRQELKERFIMSAPTSNVGRLQLLTINRIINTLLKEDKGYCRLINEFYQDQRNTDNIDLLNDFKDNYDINNEYWFTRLGGVGKDQRRCKVEIEEFELSLKEGRMVQRGCDNSIVMNIVALSDNPYVHAVVLMSGDSDFIQILKQSKHRCAEQESNKAAASASSSNSSTSSTSSSDCDSTAQLTLGPKSFSMCSYLSSFPIDVRNLFYSMEGQSNILSPEGIEYCRLENAFAELNPQCPNLNPDPSGWLKRYAIPAGYYDSDFTQRALSNGHSGSIKITEEVDGNYNAALKRLEEYEEKHGTKLAYHVGRLKVSELIRIWPERAIAPISVIKRPLHDDGTGRPQSRSALGLNSISNRGRSVNRASPYSNNAI